MARGVNLDFVANVAGFLRGTSDVERSLDQVGGSLDDVAAKGTETTDKMEADFRSTFDSVQAQAKSAGPKIAGDLDDGVRGTGKGKAKETGKEIGGELAQNIGEGIGSGQANIADTLQGTIGGVLPALGLAAAGIGLGASLGLGLIKGIQRHRAAAIAAAKKFGTDVASAISDGVIDVSDKQNLAQAALGVDNWEDAASKIAKSAKAIGVSANTYTDALAGNVKAQQDVAAAVANTQSKLDAQDKVYGHMGGSVGKGGGAGGGTVPVLTKAQRELQKSIDDVKSSVGKSNDAFAAASQQQSDSEQALHGNADAAQDAARQVDQLNQHLGKLAGTRPVKIPVEIEVSQASIQGARNKIAAAIKSGRYELP